MPSRTPPARRAHSAPPAARPLVLDGNALSIPDVVAVARHARAVRIGPRALRLMRASRAVVDRAIASGSALYGINTGFGSLSKQRISDADLADLQRNLIRSHAAGIGEPLPPDVVRAMMLLLAASLCRGHSGVRPVVAQTIVAMLNAGITPVVPSVGSVGASGDLAPLAAIALAAIGEGKVTPAPSRNASLSERSTTSIPAAHALRRATIKPLTLAAKEGLALINGTHLMAAQGALLVHDAERLERAATVALAMSIDACRASVAFLDQRLYDARPSVGIASTVAADLRQLLAGSQIVPSHAKNDSRVQDPYSLRAAPTVLSAALDAMAPLSHAVSLELAAVTDNPLVFPHRPPHVVSGANFHGMPLALPLDYLSIAFCHLAGIAERRIYLMTGAFEPESHLKPFLAPNPGLQSGLMIAQYTAAACVNEMVTLATPASVANIPTSAGMEDYNSFGPRAAAKARRALELAEHVVAIELLCAAQGIESHRPLRSGKAVEAAHATIRRAVPPLTADRHLTPDIEAIVRLIRAGDIA
ncbi:MAG: histidine ammonia-lyase [Phycisphaerae bacterium]|nr:histidine ammonia-lyase [Phycisphaerae bacterium]